MLVSSGTTWFTPVIWWDAACLVFADWTCLIISMWVTGPTLLMFRLGSKVPDVFLSLGSRFFSTCRVGPNNSLSRTTEYKSNFGGNETCFACVPYVSCGVLKIKAGISLLKMLVGEPVSKKYLTKHETLRSCCLRLRSLSMSRIHYHYCLWYLKRPDSSTVRPSEHSIRTARWRRRKSHRRQWYFRDKGKDEEVGWGLRGEWRKGRECWGGEVRRVSWYVE